MNILYKTAFGVPGYETVLLRDRNKYAIMWECEIDCPHFHEWRSLDYIMRQSIRWSRIETTIEGRGLVKFIRDYVGEAQWILAVLESL